MGYEGPRIVASRCRFNNGTELITLHSAIATATLRELANPHGPPRCDPGGWITEVWGPMERFPDSWKPRIAIAHDEYVAVVAQECVIQTYLATFSGPSCGGDN